MLHAAGVFVAGQQGGPGFAGHVQIEKSRVLYVLRVFICVFDLFSCGCYVILECVARAYVFVVCFYVA